MSSLLRATLSALSILLGACADAEAPDEPAPAPGLPPLPVADRSIDAIVRADQQTVSFGDATFALEFYRNSAYSCGLSGSYTFMIVNPVGGSAEDEAPLWVYLHGGGSGYFDADGTYYATNTQTEDTWNHEETFDSLVQTLTARTIDQGALEDNTLTRRLLEGYRIAVVSMCDQDMYAGLGTPYPNTPSLDAEVNGLQSTMAATDYIVSQYPTTHVFAHGSSAGSVGAYVLSLIHI